MAIASTPTLMSLDQYAAILGVSPVHFNQAFCARYPDEKGCMSIWYQYDWQYPGRASREELAMCLAQAEAMIADLVGFWSAPKWEVAEDHRYPKQRYMTNSISQYYPSMSTGYRKTAETNWKHFIEGGRRNVETIELAVAVNFSDPDGDGFDEVATITPTYSGTGTLAASEVAVFFGTDTADENRVRYLDVTLGVGGAITITGPSAQFFHPELWQNKDLINADDVVVSYVDVVNVYRIYNSGDGDANAPATFFWQSAPCGCLRYDYGVLQYRNPEAGIVTPIPATWDASASAWTTARFAVTDEPDLTHFWYRSGWPIDSRGRIQAPFARAIAALASALLSRPICGCGNANKQVGRWQQYPSAEIPVSYRHLDCPWGNRLGAWEAYALLTRHFGEVGALSL